MAVALDTCLCFFILVGFNGTQAVVLRQGYVAPNSQIYLSSFNFIYPGTKWCGEGDIAKHYYDLGKSKYVDKCCREHDFCNKVIFKGERKYMLENISSAAKLHCNCDTLFYNCLKKLKEETISANVIGTAYFDIYGPQCFDYRPPAKCVLYYEEVLDTKEQSFRRCKKYEYNCDEAYEWQWFDLPYWNLNNCTEVASNERSSSK